MGGRWHACEKWRQSTRPIAGAGGALRRQVCQSDMDGLWIEPRRRRRPRRPPLNLDSQRQLPECVHRPVGEVGGVVTVCRPGAGYRVAELRGPSPTSEDLRDLPRLRRRAYAHHMLRLLRFAILVVMTLIVISLVIAVARPETGPTEKVVLGVAIVGFIVAARPVQRLGSRGA